MICFLGIHVSFRRKKQSVKWRLTSSLGKRTEDGVVGVHREDGSNAK